MVGHGPTLATISIEADASCSEVDAGDGEAPPKVTIADLLSGKAKP